MKKISALVLALMMSIAVLAPACFAAEADTAANTGISVVSSSPADGAKGVAVDNFSVKLYFSQEMMPASDAIKKANEAQFTLTDEDGETIPIKVYYSEKEQRKGLMMVAADYSNNNEKNVQIKGATEYTLTIGKDLQATDGTTLGQSQTIKVTTLNQQRSTMVYMLLMFAMMGGMVFFTIRSTKKAAEKEKEEKSTKKAVNPYKEAKKSGKSIEEIVEKDKKAKAKQEAAQAKQKELEKELEAEILEKMRKERNKRVKAARPISAAGSTYKVTVQKTQPQPEKKSNKGTTNPKNQSGKKKNTGKKKGKK